MNLPKFGSTIRGLLPLATGQVRSSTSGRAFDMPKSREYSTGLHKEHAKNKNKEQAAIDGTANICYLQFLGSGAVGAPRSLYFFTDKKRYIFNVGEGTQRLAHEHKVKIARMEHVFITYPIWENIGGLPGLALTLQECNVSNLTLHGPKGLLSLFDATKRFVILNNLNIYSAICEKNTSYQDSSVTIDYVPLVSKDLKTSVNESCSLINITRNVVSGGEDVDFYCKNDNTKTAPSVMDPIESCMNVLSACAPVAMAYICKLAPKAGTLDLQKCVEKGVPPGPLLGQLKNGLDVILPNGMKVKSEDVREPDEKGPSFIVVDCPSVEFIDALTNENSFQKFQEENNDAEILLPYIIHFTPSEVMNDYRYQKWMQRFSDKTLHVNANDKNKCLGCVGAHDIQYKLNMLDSEVFPLLKDDSIPVFEAEVSEITWEAILENARIDKAMSINNRRCSRNMLNLPDNCGSTLRMLPLRPTNYENTNVAACVYLEPEHYLLEIKSIPGLEKEIQTLKANLVSLESKIDSVLKEQLYPRITFLGTGSCIPNKCRNTSGILVSLKNDNHVLMDCGEGTYGQIVRHFGLSHATEILANLNIIFISHLHADHHIGLIQILKNRRKAIKLLNSKREKIFLLAPKTILSWLMIYEQQFEEVLDCVEFVANEDLEYRSKVESIREKLLQVGPLQDVVTSYVIHCPHAFGISIVHANGYKITYSGDTMPSKDLIRIGESSHLLIHEATFDDSLSSEAKQKFHSTTSEAIQVGKKMNAKFLILTHFSQRYAKIPLITDCFTENVGIAFDNMEVSMGDLPKLHLFNPLLQMMFAEEIEQMKIKCLKRKRSSHE